MSTVRMLTVGEAEQGLRVDRWFKQHFPGLRHGQLEKLLRTGQVRVDGRRAKSGTRLEAGQCVRIPPLPEETAEPAAGRLSRLSRQDVQTLRSAVLYRDESVIAINKPAGLAVQGGTGQHRHLDAMLEALRFDAAEAPRLVHRLDKDTSGVLLLARDAAVARLLTAAFKGKEVRKTYWAAVAGVPGKVQGRIDLPLAKQAGRGGEKMGRDRESGKEAVTLYRLAARCRNEAAWLVLRPLTGRTHQLRAHCAALGHPILGDGKYGGRQAFPALDKASQALRRLQLHAREIALPHPADGTTLRIAAPLPDHMVESWAYFGFDPEAGAKAGAALEELAFSR